MNVQPAEIARKINSLLYRDSGKVLIVKHHDLTAIES